MMQDKEFDKYIKSVLQDAEEEVPDGIWNAVSDKLDGLAPVAKPKVVTFRRVALAAALIAAAVCSLFLLMPFVSNDKHVGSKQPLIAVRGTDSSEKSDEGLSDERIARAVEPVGAADVVSGKKTGHEEASPAKVIIAEEVTEEKATITKKTTIPGETISDKTAVSEKDSSEEQSFSEETSVEKKQSGDGYNPDPFALMEAQDRREEEAGSLRSSLFFTGDLERNASQMSASSRGPLKVNGNRAPSKTTLKEISESSYGIPFSVGVGVRIGLSRRLSVGAGLDYSYLTRKFTGTYIEVNKDGDIVRTVSADVSNRQHYFGIPVNVYYKVFDGAFANAYVFGGGTIEKCLSNNNHINCEPKSINFKKSVSGFQVSTAVGLGIQLNVTKRIGVFFDPSVKYYFDCDQPKSIRTQQQFMVGLEAGCRLDL